MQVNIPLHEFDAGEVLPVAHRLLEECLVEAAEVAIDLKGDDTVVPDALLLRGDGTRKAAMLPHKIKVAKNQKK